MYHSHLEGKFPGPEAEKYGFVCIFRPGASPIPEAIGPGFKVPNPVILLLSSFLAQDTDTAVFCL